MSKKNVWINITMLFCFAVIFTSCAKGEEDGSGNDDVTVVVKEDGTVSKGYIFSVLDYKNFYINHVKYSVVEGHLEVTGFDKTAFSGIAKIVSSLNYRGNAYRVVKIADGAFYDCDVLTFVSVPNSITEIGSSAFKYCKFLKSVTIPNSVRKLGSGGFSGCEGLTSITIPNSVTELGEDVFGNCSSLKSVFLPNTIVSLGVDFFYGCTSLISITIPGSVTKISEYAFYNCTSLKDITCLAKTPPTIKEHSFEPKIAKLHVLPGCKKVYEQSKFADFFISIIEDAKE